MDDSYLIFISIILYCLFNMAVGSLLNVIIYRLPIMIKNEWVNECKTYLNIENDKYLKLNLFTPRSHCPSCMHTISWYHNVPLFTYLYLRGKCAYCSFSIPKKYFFVEFITLTLALSCLFFFSWSWQLLCALLLIYFLVAIAFIDLEHQIIPDSLSLSLLWLGLLINSVNIFITPSVAIFSAVLGYLSLWLFIKIFYLFTGKVGMGNGDFKLFAAFGAWFGYIQLPLILIIAALLGSIIGSIYLKISKNHKDTPIPFGPFLCIAALASLFFGNDIITWYISFF